MIVEVDSVNHNKGGKAFTRKSGVKIEKNTLFIDVFIYGFACFGR